MNNNLITELVCTRISHDIIGNIGAVANAVELLEEGDLDFLDDIKSILKNSSQTLTARMKFFRMAFGIDNNNLEDKKLVENMARDYLKTIGNKDFPIGLSFDVQSTKRCKPALLMIMILADLLIRGGDIKVEEQKGVITASIETTAKISTDKLQKLENAVYNKIWEADAGMAPFYDLLNLCSPAKINLRKDEQKIELVTDME